jgi:EF hand
MKKTVPILLAFAGVAMLMSWAAAQPPAGKADDKDYSNSSIVTKMMAFNTKKDGKLTKEQVTDPRLHRLFDLADTNKDGVVTREELLALAAKLEAEIGPAGGKGCPKGKGFGGFGDKGDKGPRGKGPGFDDDKGPKDKGGFDDDKKGPKGKGPKGPPPRPGQILPPFVQDMLNLTGDQRKQLDTLQKEVDTRLGKILTEEQRTQLKEMQDKGPGKGPGFDDKKGPRDKGPKDR